MFTKSILVFVFASAAFVQTAPLPYPSEYLQILELSSRFGLIAPPYPRLGGEPARDLQTPVPRNERLIVAPGIKINRRDGGCHIAGNILSGSCRRSSDGNTIIFDQPVSTPAKRGDVTWHTTTDDDVVFDQPVSIAAKRDGCSVTADGRVIGDRDLCHLTPEGTIAFNDLVSIPAKRDDARKSEISNLYCYLRGSDSLSHLARD